MCALVVTPIGVNAQETSATTTPSATFSRDGIFGCTGGNYGAVGVQGPSGSFVPVFDDALFDQQRLLTYKECLLDGIATSAREAVISRLVQTTIESTTGANGGEPAFVTNPQRQAQEVENEAFIAYFDSPEFQRLPGAHQDAIREMLTREYARATRQDGTPAICPLTDEQIRIIRNGGIPENGGYEARRTYLSTPGCSLTGALAQARSDASRRVAQASRTNETLLSWGNGFLSQFATRTINLGNGQSITEREIVTPGFLIAQQLSQVLGTGLRQAENADEVDSLVSNALINLGTRMLVDVTGFSGLAQSFGGQPSYVAQLATDSANRAREKMVGAAAGILNTALSTEQEYLKAHIASENILINAARNIRSWEAQCYADMEREVEREVTERVKQNVCPASTGTSTIPCGVNITVTKTLDLNVLDVVAIPPDTLTVSGGSARAGSRIEVIVSTPSATTTVSAQATAGDDKRWFVDSITVDSLPEGVLTVSATEYFKDGSGTRGPVTASVEKSIVDGVVVLTAPTALPSVTITASASGYTASLTLTRSRERSTAVIENNLANNLRVAQIRVREAQKSLSALITLRNALSAATSVAGQREVLATLDKMVAARVLHTESDVRSAQQQAQDLQSNLSRLLEETRTSWEGGWCDPDNWSNHTL